MLKRILFFTLLLVVGGFTRLMAQPTWTFNLLDSSKRSKKFEERKLGSEKMAEKKFTKFRRVVQNNFTHFNYYFNANNKINAVIERAKIAQKDDFTKPLSYYPYTLDNTATQKTELDSVILKATAGILIHDLRNDWIDNMYLLMGKAYFYRKDFDSAAATFQFINYNLFPRNKNEDDSRVVGTKDASTNGVLSIANKEKPNILQKLTAQPPSRNDALIWMCRTLIEQGEMGEAAALIATLQQDPNLPKRLVNDLEELMGYWFFKQDNPDSAAVHLEAGLSNAETIQDRARAEFLLAQLFENAHEYDKASTYYNKAANHTTDPLMSIYAQLNDAKMMRFGADLPALDKAISNLLKMANKDKFEAHRDIIYFSAAELALQKPDTTNAIVYIKKSIKYNQTNIPYKNKGYLKLADMAFNRKEFKTAFAMYDSLQSGDTTIKEQLASIQARRTALGKIVDQINIIEKEDSLLKIATMPELERKAFVKKLSRALRKAQGLKEDESYVSDAPIEFDSKKKNEPVDLFAGSDKGEWYFYNAASKSKGAAEFKRKWGSRTNADNWRRKSAVVANATGAPPSFSPGNLNPDAMDADQPDAANKPGLVPPQPDLAKKDEGDAQPDDNSFEGLMSNLPLTEEKRQKSLNRIANSLFELAQLYQNELEDYPIAIDGYHNSLQRFPDSMYQGNLYLGLYYCYLKLGNQQKADYYKRLLSTQFTNSTANKMLTNPSALSPLAKTPEGTKKYGEIYTLFIEGNFTEALNQKKQADSIYGNNYWTPQLLYIEAVYHIKQKSDSVAVLTLNNIVKNFPKSPLKPKAEKLIDVLNRRAEIEEYLQNLQVTRMKEDSILYIPEPVTKLVRNDSNLIKSPKLYDTVKIAPVVNPPVAKDTVVKKNNTIANAQFSFNPDAPQQVVMLLDKVDGTYVNETKNALERYSSDYFRALELKVSKDAISKDTSLVIFRGFPTAAEAMNFIAKIRKAAPEEISWLPPNKYSFILISEENLELLRTKRNLQPYKELLNKAYPGQF